MPGTCIQEIYYENGDNDQAPGHISISCISFKHGEWVISILTAHKQLLHTIYFQIFSRPSELPSVFPDKIHKPASTQVFFFYIVNILG